MSRRVKGGLGSLLLRLAARRAELDPNEDDEDAPAVVEGDEDNEGDKDGDDSNADGADEGDETAHVPKLRRKPKPLSLSQQLLVDFEDEDDDGNEDDDDEDYVPEPGALDESGAPTNPFIAALTSGLKRKAHAFGSIDDSESNSDEEEEEAEEEEQSREESSDSADAEEEEDDIDPSQRPVNEEQLTTVEEVRALQREAVMPIEELGVLYATEASASEAACSSSSSSGFSAGSCTSLGSSSSSSLALTPENASHSSVVADPKCELTAKAEPDVIADAHRQLPQPESVAKPELDAKSEPEAKAPHSAQSEASNEKGALSESVSASAEERPQFKKVKPRNQEQKNATSAKARHFNPFMRLAELAAGGEAEAGELDALEGSSSGDEEAELEMDEDEEEEERSSISKQYRKKNSNRLGLLPKSSPPLTRRPCPVFRFGSLNKPKAGSRGKTQKDNRHRTSGRKNCMSADAPDDQLAADEDAVAHLLDGEMEGEEEGAGEDDDDDDEDDDEMYFGFGPESEVVRAFENCSYCVLLTRWFFLSHSK